MPTMPIPPQPKIYHIVHLDRLSSILSDGQIHCDAAMQARSVGTSIGMDEIKSRRLRQLTLSSHPSLHVGDCVPFYFCPRSIMLYLLHKGNARSLPYKDGQDMIIHLQADLHQVVEWADNHQVRWAFTLSNAGAFYFEDRNKLSQLAEINWEAVQTDKWSGEGIPASVKEGKQAEFLVEMSFPWTLVSKIGVKTQEALVKVGNVCQGSKHVPPVELIPQWYY